MSGTKTLVNNCSGAILVTLLTRAGDNPHTPTVRGACADIGAGQSTNVTYGDDRNPFLNGIIVLTTNGSMYSEQSWTVIERGGPGTLDALLNTNSVVEIGFNTETNSFTLTAHN